MHFIVQKYLSNAFKNGGKSIKILRRSAYDGSLVSVGGVWSLASGSLMWKEALKET